MQKQIHCRGKLFPTKKIRIGIVAKKYRKNVSVETNICSKKTFQYKNRGNTKVFVTTNPTGTIHVVGNYMLAKESGRRK